MQSVFAIIFQEEQDIKALQAKNRKLGEALDQRQVGLISLMANHSLACSTGDEIMHNDFYFQVIEDELRERVERLETRQATDDASLLILNRYWNQVGIFMHNTNKNNKMLIFILPFCIHNCYSLSNSLMKILNSSSDVMTK